MLLVVGEETSIPIGVPKTSSACIIRKMQAALDSFTLGGIAAFEIAEFGAGVENLTSVVGRAIVATTDIFSSVRESRKSDL